MSKYKLFIALSISSAVLVGCGGSSSSDSSDDLIGETEWVSGVFEDEENFKNLCETPRSGNDPFNNNQPYPDMQGSLKDEKFYLRSWNNRTYLWYREVVDRDPANYATPVEYFNVLKSTQTTPSGAPKDQFHFTYDTEEYMQLSQTGTSSGYGVEWAVLQATPPRKIVVAYTESDTPADNAGITRGAEVLEIDGVDVVNVNTEAGIAVLSAGLRPSEAGESHTFKIRDLGASEERTVTLVSEVISSNSVLHSNTFDTDSGRVGYVVFNAFNARAEEDLLNVFTQFADSSLTDLVLDLRYNGGGRVYIASQLAYMIAGASNTSGKIFSQYVFNDQHPVFNPVTGTRNEPVEFISETVGEAVAPGQPLPSLNLDRVFVLSTSGTCSASEAVINGLRGAGVEVILIGDTTCGKPYGFYPNDNCGTTYFTVQLKIANDEGFGDYADGFSPANTMGTLGVETPGCSVADDFENLLGDLNESLLSAALEYRASGTCPAPSVRVNRKDKSQNLNGLSILDSEVYLREALIRNNQFINGPVVN